MSKKPWTYHDEIKSPGRGMINVEGGPPLWLVSNFKTLTSVVPYNEERSEVYRFDFRMSRPTFCAGGEEVFAEYLGASTVLSDVTYVLLAIYGLHVGLERQTIASVFVSTKAAWAGFGGPDDIQLLKWPTEKLRNMQMAHPARKTTSRRDGTVVHSVSRPFAPDPPLIGFRVFVRDTPLHDILVLREMMRGYNEHRDSEGSNS